jgi:hypothetical protein
MNMQTFLERTPSGWVCTRCVSLELQKSPAQNAFGLNYGIVPYVFRRWLERLGMGALRIGPKFMIGKDVSQAAIIDVDTV